MKFLIIILLSALAGGLLAVMGWPIEILYVVVVVCVVISITNIFYTNAFSKNKEAIAKYLKKHKKDPIYHFAYILPTASNDELIAALEKILAKYKNTKYQAIYGSYLALLQDDPQAARKYTTSIVGTEHGRYTNALIDLHEGHYDAAKKIEFKKEWMKYSILAHLAYYKKDFAKLEQYAALAIDQVGGIQHYVNFYSFEKMKRDLQKDQP